MSDKESPPIRNGIIISVVSGILLSFWPPFRELIVSGTSWVWSVTKNFGTWLSSPQDVYGWTILLLVGLTIPTIFEILSLALKKKDPGIEDLYKSDCLFGVDWQWSYLNGSILNLWCLCPNCKSELVYSEFSPDPYDYTYDHLEPKTDFICERCNTSRCTLKGDKRYALSTVKREIRRKIRNNEWQNEQHS